jgi:antitoxin MazE
MRAEIIRIGNSKGLRIPKAILEQCGMKHAVNLQVSDHALIVTPCEEVRSGWREAFQRMAANNDDLFLDTDSMVHSWDDEEWQW